MSEKIIKEARQLRRKVGWVKPNNFPAFTLAEVLITLGVIGVVASMTIPTLISNHQKKTVATRFKKAYSELYQAVKLSEAHNGEVAEWNFNFSDDVSDNTKAVIETYLIPYYNNLKFCSIGRNEPKCGEVYGGTAVNYKTNNGTGLSFYVKNDLDFIGVMIDIDGANSQNIIGTDAMPFQINKNGKLLPVGWIDGLTREQVINGFQPTDSNDIYSCKDVAYDENNKFIYANRDGCSALFYLDGFEFKSDYPFKIKK